jgi:hypothetical protein
MRSLLFAFYAWSLLLLQSHAQGTLNFVNRIAGEILDAPITAGNPDTGFGIFANAKVQLFLVNGTTLSPVGTAIGFRDTSGVLAKYFNGGTISVTGAPVGSSPTLRVRAWAGGATFDVATIRAESSNFTAGPLGGDLGNGNPPTLPADMLNMRGFSSLPEPTTIGAMILGLGIFALRTKRTSKNP